MEKLTTKRISLLSGRRPDTTKIYLDGVPAREFLSGVDLLPERSNARLKLLPVACREFAPARLNLLDVFNSLALGAHPCADGRYK